MQNQICLNSFYREVELMRSNFEKVNKGLPETYIAAETLRDLFEELIGKRLNLNTAVEWEYSSSLMLFGAFQSWVVSYLMTSVGFHDISLMSLRRAIEYTCYLAKIQSSNERAKFWLDKFDSQKTRKIFTSKFSVPEKYLTDKYIHLKHLLILYDYTSDFGTHGNFEVLVSKMRDDADNKRRFFILQDVDTSVSVSLGMILLLGYRILQSALFVLKQNIQDVEEFEKRIAPLSSMIKTARLKSANSEHDGNAPKDLLDAINEDTSSYTDEAYSELVLHYKKSKETA